MLIAPIAAFRSQALPLLDQPLLRRGRALLPLLRHSIILQNFAVNAAESQMSAELTEPDGAATPLGRRLEELDMFFTIIFTVWMR